MPVAELTRARIEQLQIDPDDLYSREWVEFDHVTVDARLDPNVVVSTWGHEQDDELPSALYRAVLPGGARSDDVRFPDPNRRRSAA